MLSLTGDKRFLIADTNDAFLMYAVRGSSAKARDIDNETVSVLRP